MSEVEPKPGSRASGTHVRTRRLGTEEVGQQRTAGTKVGVGDGVRG